MLPESEFVRHHEEREANLALAAKASAILAAEGEPYIDLSPFVRVIHEPEFEYGDYYELASAPFHTFPAELQTAILSEMDEDVQGVIATTHHKKGEKRHIQMKQSQTDEGVLQCEPFVDVNLEGLSFPVTCMSVWGHEEDPGHERDVQTPYGNLPRRVIDANGDLVSFYEELFLLDADGKGGKVIGVANQYKPTQRDGETAHLLHVEFVPDSHDSHIVAFNESERGMLVGILDEISRGEWEKRE